MPERVIGDVVLHLYIVGAVDGDATAETVVDGCAPDVAAGRVACLMPVDGIAGQPAGLAHVEELDLLHPGGAARHCHQVPAERVGHPLVCPADGDGAGEMSDLGPFVNHPPVRPQELAPVRMLERFGEANGGAAHRRNGPGLGLVEFEVGRGTPGTP